MGKQKRIKCSLLIFHAKIADSPYLQANLPSQSPILSPGKLLSILQHVSHISNITYILQIYETSCYYLLKKKVSVTTVTPQIFNNSSQKMVYCWQKNWQILNRPNSTVGSGIQLPLHDTSAIQEPNVYRHNLWYRQTWITDESNRSNKRRNIPLPPYFRDHCGGRQFLHARLREKRHRHFQHLQQNHTKKQDGRRLPDAIPVDPRGTTQATLRRAPRCSLRSTHSSTAANGQCGSCWTRARGWMNSWGHTRPELGILYIPKSEICQKS